MSSLWVFFEGVVAQWCNLLTLQPEQSGGAGSKPGRAPPLERHDNTVIQKREDGTEISKIEF